MGNISWNGFDEAMLWSCSYRCRGKPAISKLSIIAFALMVILAGCIAPPPCAGKPAILATFYFGRMIPSGGEVNDAQWRRFVASVVTPAFPDGFTVTDGKGQWFDPKTHEVISERVKILVVAILPDSGVQAKLAQVRNAYATAFHQESVGLTQAPVCASF